MRRLHALLPASLVVLLAACGGGGGVLDIEATASPAFLAASAERTVAYDTGRAEITFTATGVAEQPDPVVVRATAAFDLPAQQVAATVDLSALAAFAGAEADPGVAQLLRALTQSSEVVVDGTDVYLKPGGLGALLGALGGKPWLKIDAAAAGEPELPPASIPAVDPAELLETLKRLGGTVTEVGAEDVRGVATTHYRTTFDDGSGRTGDLDVWIDAAGIVRRVKAVGTDGGVTIEVVADLFDLGADVGISVPPADQVAPIDAAALDGLFGRPR